MSTLTDTFQDIADAIRTKTGNSETMTPAEMPSEIESISVASGNAASDDVLSGKTFSNASGAQTGSMTNNGAVSQALDTSTTSYTIPAGYHNGSGSVSIVTQSKNVTPSANTQTVTPDSGKVLASVIVAAAGGGFNIVITALISALYGKTITIKKGSSTIGTTTFNSSGEASYTVSETGTYELSATANNITYTESIDIQSYAISLGTPDGATVTPVNDIQTWLHCADIWNKSYTTIAQVLADNSTLLALISSNNAVDYMVRSTDWATDVCADETAMTYIGANDYCAETLLGGVAWREAICNSTYFESVLTVSVPTMTSNTTPSGEVIYKLLWTGQAYKVFDGNESTNCGVYSYTSNSYSEAFIGYVFPTKVAMKKIKIFRTNEGHPIAQIKLLGSNDGNTYTTIIEQNVDKTNYDFDLVFQNNTSYKYYKCQVGEGTKSNAAIVIHTMQIYGR